VELLRDIWDLHMLSNFGKYARLFEQRAQAQLGTPRVRAVASCDIGLVIALAALDLPAGGEAIVPSFTFNSTINAIVWNRLTPVFADIDPWRLTLDPAEVERLTGPGTAVVVGTHVFGNPCDHDAIRAAAGPGIPVVYDAAHAFGTRYRGRAAGTLGDAEVFSFSGTKLVTSAEGGLVAVTRDDLVTRIEYLRAYGFQTDYESHVVGINGKISELNAALGALTIETLQEGDLIGWSWLFPPYTTAFDARSLEDTHTLVFDGACLRAKCDLDPALGYGLLKLFAGLVVQRLQNARFQLLDVYGTVAGS